MISRRRSRSATVGLGHEVQSFPDVRRAEIAGSQTMCPEGVALRFQVVLNKVEPHFSVSPASLACSPSARLPDDLGGRDLLPEDDEGTALADEGEPGWPEVTFVGGPSPPSRVGIGLAGAGAGPAPEVVGDSREAEGVGPDPDSGEPMALGEPPDVVGTDVPDVSLIDLSLGNLARRHEPAQPFRAERIDFVVVGPSGHARLIPSAPEGAGRPHSRKIGVNTDLLFHLRLTRKNACWGFWYGARILTAKSL